MAEPTAVPSRIWMVYKISGATQNDHFDAPHRASVQIHHEGQTPVGHVKLYDEKDRLVREVIYGCAQRAERAYLVGDQ